MSKEELKSYERTSVQQLKTTLAVSVPAPKLPNDNFKQDGEFQPRNNVNPGEILKPLDFQAVQECTFNISLKL